MIQQMADVAALVDVPEPELQTVTEQLLAFEALVRKWNPAINVVAKSTVDDLWQRHILDSVQIFQLCPPAGLWLDLGSGGGFPGMIVAILARHLRPNLKVRMVESDRRKAVFLKECIRQLGLTADVVSDRIESLPPQGADVVSARALAPLGMLCDFAFQHLSETGVGVFLKGQRSDDEIAEAGRSWKFDLERLQSVTSRDASILVIKGLRHG